MIGIIEAAGWPIWPIIAASIIALAIIGERFWALRSNTVAPKNLLSQVVEEYRAKGVSQEMVNRVAQGSVLGRVFAAGLRNVTSSREVMKESIEEAGRGAVHELSRFISPLGTIASIAPIMGLLGTVIGMIEIFGSQNPSGASPAQLAHGISVALYNTAFGLIVAIPSMIFYRHFRSRVDALVVEMEQQAVKLVEIVHGDRQA
ncbi:MAG: MotA/TolQ/ExbB proton channel family protein [Burkholderiales bacterium]